MKDAADVSSDSFLMCTDSMNTERAQSIIDDCQLLIYSPGSVWTLRIDC